MRIEWASYAEMHLHLINFFRRSPGILPFFSADLMRSVRQVNGQVCPCSRPDADPAGMT